MTDKYVVDMLKQIKSCYQNFVLNNDVADAWIEIFSEYEKEPIMASLKKYIRTNEYPPTPASIIKIYEEGKAVMNRSIGKDIGDLVEILTFALGKTDVFGEVEEYRAWLNKKSEMERMSVSRRTITKLRETVKGHDGKFDFSKWLMRGGD